VVGLDNGVPTADMNPGMLAPTADEQLQWPVWGMYYLSNGQKGKAPDLPEAIELVDLLEQWKKTTDMAERAAVWTKMLELYSDQVFSIGIVNASRAAHAALGAAAQHARRRPLRLRSHLLSRRLHARYVLAGAGGA
jgi:ABC-type transport system substrate-binding protein